MIKFYLVLWGLFVLLVGLLLVLCVGDLLIVVEDCGGMLVLLYYEVFNF